MRKGDYDSPLYHAFLDAGQQAGHPEIDAYVRARAGTDFHPVGTCRIGSGRDAVVDHELRVHGIAGLRVANLILGRRLPPADVPLPSSAAPVRSA